MQKLVYCAPDTVVFSAFPLDILCVSNYVDDGTSENFDEFEDIKW